MYCALSQVQALPAGLLHVEHAYAGLHHRVAVPISVRESMPLARRLPIVWRRAGTGSELVALRGLSSAALVGLDETPRPLLIEAFPFAAVAHEDDGFALMLDQVEADSEFGRPALTPDGEPSTELQHRLDALEVYLLDTARTRRITGMLATHNLLEEWNVDLTISGQNVRLEGLAIVVRDTALRWTRLNQSGLATDLDVIRLIVAHDLSLFHMQDLVTAFRHNFNERKAKVPIVEPLESTLSGEGQ